MSDSTALSVPSNGDLSPRLLKKRLTDDQASQLLRIDLKQIHVLRKITHGEPLFPPETLQRLKREWQAEIASQGISDPHLQDRLLDCFVSAFKAGAASTVNPMPIVRAFDTFVKVGHSKLWREVEAKTDGARSVTINVNVGRPPADASVIDVPVEESKS